jgi:hypothetical protein
MLRFSAIYFQVAQVHRATVLRVDLLGIQDRLVMITVDQGAVVLAVAAPIAVAQVVDFKMKFEFLLVACIKG